MYCTGMEALAPHLTIPQPRDTSHRHIAGAPGDEEQFDMIQPVPVNVIIEYRPWSRDPVVPSERKCDWGYNLL